MAARVARPSTPRLITPALLVALLGFMTTTLDALIVSVTLPVIGNDLGGGITGLQWVVDGYLLMFAGLLLAAGSLSDRFGARQAFLVGFAVFTAASIACGLAPVLPALVVARLVQGLGAALMTPASLALIRETYPDPVLRARAVAVWAMGGAIGSALGPILGGTFGLVNWRLIFLVNVPFGAVVIWLIRRVGPSIRHRAPLDVAGQVTAVVATFSAVYAVIESGVAGLNATRVVVAAALAAIAAAGFLVLESRVAHPMVPLRMFRSRVVAVVMAGGFAFTLSYYGVIFVLSLFLQREVGLTPLETGMTFVPMTVLTAVMPFLGARIASRHGSWLPITVGLLLNGASLFGVRDAVAHASAVGIALWFIPLAIGGSLAVPCMTSALLENVPVQLVGTASGIFNTGRQLGGAFGVAVFGALVARPGRAQAGTEASLVIAALPLLVLAVLSFSLRPSRSQRLRRRSHCDRVVEQTGQAPMTEPKRDVTYP